MSRAIDVRYHWPTFHQGLSRMYKMIFDEKGKEQGNLFIRRMLSDIRAGERKERYSPYLRIIKLGGVKELGYQVFPRGEFETLSDILSNKGVCFESEYPVFNETEYEALSKILENPSGPTIKTAFALLTQGLSRYWEVKKRYGFNYDIILLFDSHQGLHHAPGMMPIRDYRKGGPEK